MNESASDLEEKETKGVGVTFPKRLRFHRAHQIGEADEFRENDGREKLKRQRQEIEKSRNGEWPPKGEDESA